MVSIMKDPKAVPPTFFPWWNPRRKDFSGNDPSIKM
jgi:hypothetical protein